MELIEVINPVTGTRLHDIESHSAEDVYTAIQLGRVAQKTWSERSAKERASIAKQLANFLSKQGEALMDTLQAETGKSRAHAFEELTGGMAAVSYYARITAKTLKRKRLKAGVPILLEAYVETSALGVVGVITPWNYPLALTLMDVVPALMAGNAVVQKADNQTAKTIQLTRDIALQAGVPAAIWQVVHGEAAQVGNALTDNVDYVAFTGSTATGRLVAERAAKRLIGYSLELGGKNPMIVMPGADLEIAAETAIAAAFGNSGQLCVSIERVYVPNPVLAEFEKILIRRVDSLTLGVSENFDFDLGSLTSKAQLERIDGFINRARAQGAKLLAGGRALPELGPYFYAPTVISNAAIDSEILTKEVFGPVIVICGYESLDDAVRLANDTEFGLNASIVGDKKEALKLASRLMTGSVNVNEGYRATMASMAAPMGGMKQSGMGRRSGPGGLLRFTETRTIGVANKLLIGLPTRAKQYKKLAPLMARLTRWI